MTQQLENILEVNDLQTVFSTDGGEVRAVDGVSFVVPKGKTIGIVGNLVQVKVLHLYQFFAF